MKSLPFALILTFSVATSAALQAQVASTPPPSVWKLGTGFDYSRGKYGFAQNTEVLSVPVNVSYEESHWLLRATVPYVTVKGPASVVGNIIPLFAATARPSTQSESGLGDIVGSVTYRSGPLGDENGLNIDLTGRMKFPTADEDKGLGTGETDFYTQLDFHKTFGTVTPFATVGYRFLGSNARYQLEDGPYASAGASFVVVEGTAVGASLDWRSRVVDNAENATEATAFVSHNVNARWNLIGYALSGFTDASPDFGFGGLISYRF